MTAATPENYVTPENYGDTPDDTYPYTPKPQITLASLVRAARRKAKDTPDFVYEPPGGQGTNCRYIVDGDDGAPCGSCIWGQILLEHGVDPRWLTLWEGHPVRLILAALRREGIITDPVAWWDDAIAIWVPEVSWIDEMQTIQDFRDPWGDAIMMADSYLRDSAWLLEKFPGTVLPLHPLQDDDTVPGSEDEGEIPVVAPDDHDGGDHTGGDHEDERNGGGE